MKISEISVSYSNEIEDRIKVKTSRDCYEVFLKHWNMETIELQEEFKILLLNRDNQVLGVYSLSKGGTASAIVDAKLVFSVALKCNATSLIFAHNHPSGNLKPSESDIKLTKRFARSAKLLDMLILDHLIITKKGFYSLADNSEM